MVTQLLQQNAQNVQEFTSFNLPAISHSIIPTFHFPPADTMNDTPHNRGSKVKRITAVWSSPFWPSAQAVSTFHLVNPRQGAIQKELSEFNGTFQQLMAITNGSCSPTASTQKSLLDIQVEWWFPALNKKFHLQIHLPFDDHNCRKQYWIRYLWIWTHRFLCSSDIPPHTKGKMPELFGCIWSFSYIVGDPPSSTYTPGPSFRTCLVAMHLRKWLYIYVVNSFQESVQLPKHLK